MNSSPDIKMIKSRNAGRAFSAHWKIRNSYKILAEYTEGKRPLKNLGMDGEIILKLILEK